MEKRTIMEVMKGTVDKFGGRVALKTKLKGSWEETTWQAYYNQVRTTARAFMALGLEKDGAISILGNNRPQWVISNMAAIFAGGIPGGIYTTNSPEQCRYIAHHSQAAIAVVENEAQLAKFKIIRQDLTGLKAIVMMEGFDGDEQVFSWDDLPEIAKKTSEEDLDKRMNIQKPDDCCSLIYTSGTTGNPKGVMLSHDNIAWTAQQVVDAVKIDHTDHLISYLPLSHIAEQVVSLYAPIITGSTSWFAESLDLLGENLTQVHPTIFVGVPRVWEKIQAKMTAAGAQNSWLKKKIAAWARKKGLEAGYAQQKNLPEPSLISLADKLVFSKVRERLGFDRCRLFISTAAPISMDSLEFFLSLGIPVTEVYGMSECSGPATLSLPRPLKYRTGWAGPPITGTEISIAGDGEVLMRGRHVFKGYFKNQEATDETIDEQGWLHSGDVGKLDDLGFLKITDRKKELLITSGGENISPQVLEGKLKSIPIVSQVVVIGDQRKYITALFTLDPEKINQTATAIKSSARTPKEASTCKTFRTHLQTEIDKINATLANVQTIKKFVILPEEFSIEGDELTPTMKLKRRIINQKYATQIEGMYT
ncbi:MAG: long-chain fatty acid--CoA ligase [Deltaproteobacteria bacterium]|nr:MAG: long-chain fatty acid--CoA ligase [Deltaproteobacteria bacterium]